MFYDLLIFIFMSYIKPQQIAYLCTVFKVVYRTIPTSNHNLKEHIPKPSSVVYRTIPTSNHNRLLSCLVIWVLYIVLFLHQTTTALAQESNSRRCISYYSYIKPQLAQTSANIAYVVYRTIPTSNHNVSETLLFDSKLYIVLFLHQTTTLK